MPWSVLKKRCFSNYKICIGRNLNLHLIFYYSFSFLLTHIYQIFQLVIDCDIYWKKYKVEQ